MPFPDAVTTACVTTFKIGDTPSSVRCARVSRPEELDALSGGRWVARDRLRRERAWSHLTRRTRPAPDGVVELGEVFRVHRAQVTGANNVWIVPPDTDGLPRSVLVPTVTRAVELIRADWVLTDVSRLRCVIDLPVDLSVFPGEEGHAVRQFLAHARAMGADAAYVARHRAAWWSVGLREPAPILATYMARRPPTFVRNRAAARHINIAHGLYPRDTLGPRLLDRIPRCLRSVAIESRGRVYAGGLMKFEPREMERILLPAPHLLGEVRC